MHVCVDVCVCVCVCVCVQRCVDLIIRAAAHGVDEAWISKHPVLLLGRHETHTHTHTHTHAHARVHMIPFLYVGCQTWCPYC